MQAGTLRTGAGADGVGRAERPGLGSDERPYPHLSAPPPPPPRRQFLALPEDLRRLYVKLLRDKHGATRQQARQLTGEDYGLRFGEGDAQKWAAFLARGKR